MKTVIFCWTFMPSIVCIRSCTYKMSVSLSCPWQSASFIVTQALRVLIFLRRSFFWPGVAVPSTKARRLVYYPIFFVFIILHNTWTNTLDEVENSRSFFGQPVCPFDRRQRVGIGILAFRWVDEIGRTHSTNWREQDYRSRDRLNCNTVHYPTLTTIQLLATSSRIIKPTTTTYQQQNKNINTTMNLFTKNNTMGYNTIVDDAEDKEAVEDPHVAEDTTTISEKNRLKLFLLLIGGSVSALIVLVVLFWATPASSPSLLPSSASSLSSSLSSFRTAAWEDSRDDLPPTTCVGLYGTCDSARECCGHALCYPDHRCYPTECRPHGDPCFGGYPASLPNGGCCATTTCLSQNNGGDACALFTDPSCVCHDNPTPAPSSSPTQAPTHPPTTPPSTSPPTITPAPTTLMYDPTQDFCFTPKFGAGVHGYKFCWYPTDDTPVGDWEGVSGRDYNDCGPKCTEVQLYDPNQNFCYKDNDNPGKYCWYPCDKIPYGNWVGEGGHGYNDCGPTCTYTGKKSKTVC